MKTSTSTGKKTARSASTRSTRPASIKEFRKFQKHDQELIERQAMQITAQFASIGQLRQKLDLAEADMRGLQLDVARHEGYIARVREMDGEARAARLRLVRAVTGRKNATGLTAEDLLAMSDREFEAVLEGRPGDMDLAMGRDEDDSDD